MKTLFAILLTAGAAFGQATVKVEHVAPNCAALGQTDMMQQLASGCFWDRIQVTAQSANPNILGFLITATYIDVNGKTKTETKVVLPGVPVYLTSADGNGNFIAAFVPVDSMFVSASAVELLSGQSMSST